MLGPLSGVLASQLQEYPGRLEETVWLEESGAGVNLKREATPLARQKEVDPIRQIFARHFNAI